MGGGGTNPPFCEQGPIARNEEFSEIVVINIFLQFSKKKHSYLWGGGRTSPFSRTGTYSQE